VGARIEASRLPVVNVPRALEAPGITPFELALHGGEDYQLLFTVSARLAAKIPEHRDGVRITQIGEIVRGHGIELLKEDGKRERVAARGWDHFARRK